MSLGESVLPLPRTLLARRPSLAGYVGRELVVGIRPEDIEDAELVPSANGASLPVQVKLAEALGAEVIAHFPLGAGDDAGPLVTARLTFHAGP